MITLNVGNYIADSQKPHVVRFSKKYVAKTTGRITWQIRYKGKPPQNGDETDIVDKYLLGGIGDGERRGILEDKYNLRFILW